MAALPRFRRIQREDIRDAPSWIDGMLFILNGFMESIYLALSHNITFSDNIASFEKSFSIKAGAAAINNTYSFLLPTTFTTKPAGLLIVACSLVAATYTPISTAVFPSWRYSNNQVLIDAITGLTSGSTYNLTVLVI